MINKIVFCLVSLTSFASCESLEGVWQANKEKDGAAGSLVMIYPHKDMYYGTIIATYDNLDEGVLETIEKPQKKAPKLVGDPYYCGLVLVWVAKELGSPYEGHIIDPEAGELYNASLRTDGDDLVLKGKFGPFFSNRPWPKAPEAALKKAFPKGLPDPKTFKSEIPEIK